MAKRLTLYLVILFCFCHYSNAQDETPPALKGTKKQLIGVFAGASAVLEDKSVGFTLDLNYEYRFLKSNFGFGFMTDIIFGDYTEMLFAVPFYFHNISPVNLKFCIAPGIAITKRVRYMFPNEQVTEFEETYNTANFNLRLGIGWEQLIFRDGVPIVAVTPLLHLNYVSNNKTYLIFGGTITWIIN
ncbi:MAG: hypothetical protein WCT77_00625 [Bacteroidota bacterium]